MTDTNATDFAVGETRWQPTTASGGERLMITVVLIAVLTSLAVTVPSSVFDPLSDTFLLSIGIIGVWRYSWWIFHALRACYYLRFRFPRIRRHAEAAGNAPVDHVYCLVTSYSIDPQVSWPVYESLFHEVASYGRPATIVAAVSHQSDVDLLERIAETVGLPDRVELVTMFQDGTGKRPAMAEALRAISRRMPTENAICIFMDGDVVVRPGALSKVVPVLQANPQIGAATADNRGMTEGGGWTREWYDLRFAQRHLLMSSMSLSGRLLVLTGRFSVIRAHLATDPSFIQQIENDAIEHWRLGRINFLSGDDKSTWFWLLKRGWGMIYLPDVRADSFEELPASNLVVGAVSLLKRWYGNMLRTSDRAIALGPHRMGLFPWWCLVDQRLSMWTSLVGPVVAIILAITYDPAFLLVYGLWILGTRTVVGSILCLLVRGRWAPHWPWMLFMNQILGGVVKSFVFFRMDRQKWTRQEITTSGSGSAGSGSAVLHGLALACFASLLVMYSGTVEWPNAATVRVSFPESRGGPGQEDSSWLDIALERLPTDRALPLTDGTYRLTRLVRSERPGRVLVGAGSDTRLEVHSGMLVTGGGVSDGATFCPPAGTLPVACLLGGPKPLELRNLVVRTHAEPARDATAAAILP
ncbi:glycosyltransferase [Thalassobaculum sp. OXR-137]|uniref:glycosyltransferase n=1 Tax=Thalassobaculum sp. OXR-137 TaxID=3100173 RepID=UPI002AC9AEDA|nr:glycosyltransferase [Thalassobaculum sp. OXR-137]WPZ32344.1 glycosyltransferase [Thalassobaculum sp. OXR-137]